MEQPKKKNAIKKKTFNIKAFKQNNGLEEIVEYKPQEFLAWNPAFNEAIGIPGLALGHVTLLRGFSNTGKSTGVYETIAAAHKLRDNEGNLLYLPVLFDTENSWNWEHAQQVGVEVEENVDTTTGEITKNAEMLYYDNDTLLKRHGKFNYADGKMMKDTRDEAVLEDVAREINILLEKQASGELPINLIFIWDSIGTLNCYKSYESKNSNNMWNAGAIELYFKQIINNRIPSTRKKESLYTNSFLGVQKIWLDSMSGGQPVVKHKGGEAFFYAARLIIHYGGQKTHGTSDIKVTHKGNSMIIGKQAKISIVKNHVTGLEYDDRKIISTAHGYVNPDKIDVYKKEHIAYLADKLAQTSDKIASGGLLVAEDFTVSYSESADSIEYIQ